MLAKGSIAVDVASGMNSAEANKGVGGGERDARGV